MRFNRPAAALAASLALAAGVAACNNDDITSLNQNPNSPENAPAGAVFTNAVSSAVGRWLGTTYDLRQLEFVVQHLSEVQYPTEDTYETIRATNTQAAFTGEYNGSLEDFKQVQIKGDAEASPAVSAPAVIMQQWEFGYLTDTWGAVPYSQALKGDSGIVLPEYDAQKDIYTGMLSALAAASTSLSAPGPQSLGAADPIYGGDPSAWQKFANSLRARDAMRISNVDPTTASAELTAAFSAPGGLFESNDDNAQLAWPGDGISNNPWSDNFQSRDDHRVSKTLIDALNATNDPRVAIFAMPTEDFLSGDSPVKYAGQPNGLSASDAGTYFTSTSRPGAIFYSGGTTYGTFGGNGAKQPSYLMTYAEVLLIKAEAAERSLGGLTPGQAAQFYHDAIEASMEQWGVPAADITAYFAQPSAAYQGGTAGLRQIANQKWIALYSDAGQAWAEWRRTCTPTLIPGPDAIFEAVPRRFEYPVSEQTVNGDNVTKAIDMQGADAMDTQLYWDTKTAPTCP